MGTIGSMLRAGQRSNLVSAINIKRAALNHGIHSRLLFNHIIIKVVKDLVRMPDGMAAKTLGDRDMPDGIAAAMLLHPNMPVNKAAKILAHKNMPVDIAARICRLLPKDRGVDILARMGSDIVENILNRLSEIK